MSLVVNSLFISDYFDYRFGLLLKTIFIVKFLCYGLLVRQKKNPFKASLWPVGKIYI